MSEDGDCELTRQNVHVPERLKRVRGLPEDPGIRGVAAWPLVATLLGAVLLGVGVIISAYVLIGVFVPLAGDAALTPAQRITAAFATATAVGALVALVVNVRKQDLAEQAAQRELTATFTQRFAAAAGQLGSSAAAERLAGVYAMAALADEYATRRQQCVDVLCGYLRLPFDPDIDELESTSKDTAIDNGPLYGIRTTRKSVATRPFDRQIRETIVRLITQHLQPDASLSWSNLTFDFTRAHLTDASFYGARFEGGPTVFRDAKFSGEWTVFEKAVFSGVTFDRATFSARGTSFSQATFSGEMALFREAKVSGKWTHFDRATFSTVEETSFDRATFSAQRTSFNVARFASKTTSFDRARFFGRRTSFDGARFAGTATTFAWTAFSGRTTFDNPVRENGALLTGLAAPVVTEGATIRSGGAPFTGWQGSSAGLPPTAAPATSTP